MASVLLVEPYNLIFKHQELVNSFCFALETHDLEVSRLSCRGIIKNNCMAHQYLGITESENEEVKQNICNSCLSAGQVRNLIFPFTEYFLEDYLTSTNLTEIDTVMTQYERQRDFATRIDNVPVGRFSLYETTLRFKLLDPKLTFGNQIELFYRTTLKNCLYFYFGVSNILEVMPFDFVLVYNPLYSVSQTLLDVTKNKKRSFVALHASSNPNKAYSRVMISNGGLVTTDVLLKWNNQAEMAPKILVKLTTLNYLRNLKRSKQPWHYSRTETSLEKQHILEKLREISKQKRIVLVPLSSSDEVNAYDSILASSNDKESLKPYVNQESFVRDIVRFANENLHLHIVVRLHPRMFANRRDKLDSHEGQMLTKLLIELCSSSSNITIDNGADIAIFDLIKLSNVVVNFMSSVGLDAMLMGHPTISIYQGESFAASYPLNISEVVYRQEELSVKILNVLKMGNSNAENASQWLYFLLKTNSKKIPRFPFSPTLFLWRLLNFKFKRTKVGSILLFFLQLVRKLEGRFYKLTGMYRGPKHRLLESSFSDHST